MTKYDMIHDALQAKVDAGELTLEDANRVDDVAYEKYADVIVTEKKDDNVELLDELKDKVEDGSVKLTKDQVDALKEMLGSAEEKEDDKASDDKEADENGEGAAEAPAEDENQDAE